MSLTPSLTVLHVGGSSETRFYFECSFLYCKAACRFPEKNVKNYYSFLLPPLDACPGAGRFALIEDEVPEELLATDLMDLKYLENPALAQKVTLVSENDFIGALRGENDYKFSQDIQLVVPHMYDAAGLTTWRTFVEAKLHLPVMGPPGSTNVIAQDKVACRSVLEKVTITAGDGKKRKGIVPSGFSLTRDELVGADGRVSDSVAAALVARVRAEAGGFPTMIKSPLEDNSLGVRLLGRQCLQGATESSTLDAELATEVKDSVLEMLGLGDEVLFEQFVSGREFRFGAVELSNTNGLDAYRKGSAGKKEIADIGARATKGKLHGIPLMLEYVMMDKTMPIRTATDKLTTDERGQMTQNKCMRRLVSCDPRVHAAPDPSSGKIAARMDADNVDHTVYPAAASLQREIEAMALAAHRALGCRGYSLFDIRVDALTGRPFIIECCAFWSFSTISVLSGMLECAGIDYKRVILDLWREQALTPSAARARMSTQATACPPSPPSPVAATTSVSTDSGATLSGSNDTGVIKT